MNSIKIFILEYDLTTPSGIEHYDKEVQDSLNYDLSYCHGNLSVKKEIKKYLDYIQNYNPSDYTNFKDAFLAYEKMSLEAYYNINGSHRVVTEANNINKFIIDKIYEVHQYDVYAFLNITIDNMIKTTRNTVRYNKILKKVDKTEVDSLIGQYIDNILKENIKKTSPTAMQDIIAKELRPSIIDIAYAFNIEKRPSKWKTESSVVKMAIKIFKGHKVIEQGSPDFLKRQRYDVWIPSLNIAIEYNGKQHYDYVPFFHRNGEEDLFLQQERDNKKRDVSKKNGVTLIEIPYTEKNIELLIQQYITNC